MLTLLDSAWEEILVGLNPFEGRKALGRTWVCLVFYHCPIPRPQCEKRLSFFGFQGFLRKIFFFVLFMQQAQTKALNTPVME